ncbi:MAG TPA: hypothetical protein VF170_08985 [Planctomycetaceae bacterium]
MLKWTARAFAMAAALQFGIASAQETEADAGADLLIPPGPAEFEGEAEIEAETQVPAEETREGIQESREEFRDDRRDAREELQDSREEALEQREAIERESRFRPDTAPSDAQGRVSDRVRAATAGLNIDDETRSRYRWHNGEWWFKTRSGNWKFYRDGRWHDFDPTTYQPPRPGAVYDSGSSFPQEGYIGPQSGYSGGYVVPQTYGQAGGYYFESRPYTNTRRYGVYRPDYEYFDGRYYRGGYGGRVYGDGYYGRGYGYGYGQGYDPGTDRYYGYGPYGRPYSIEGDRYRGGVIGSEIGGRIGGRTGSIIGGAIGAEAAD